MKNFLKMPLIASFDISEALPVVQENYEAFKDAFEEPLGEEEMSSLSYYLENFNDDICFSEISDDIILSACCIKNKPEYSEWIILLHDITHIEITIPKTFPEFKKEYSEPERVYNTHLKDSKLFKNLLSEI